MSIKNYNGKDPFIFISYSHTDLNKVESILRILSNQGFRFWYDKQGDGIEAGNNWFQFLMEKIDESSAFIGFLSSGSNYRSIVIKEISRAIERAKADKKYKIILIFLEKISPASFPEDVKNLIKECQFIDMRLYGGITRAFVDRILSVKWEYDIIDSTYRRQNGLGDWSMSKKEETSCESESFLINDSVYVYPQADFVLDETQGFYKISVGQMDIRTVYPVCLDNQWIPSEFYVDEDYLKNGLRSEKVVAAIQKEQCEEIFRGLLHNWQIIVNRASLINTKIFIDWYSGADNIDALGKLMEKGAIAVFLLKENSPFDRPRYNINNDNFKNWIRFCKQYKIFCVKFDWQNYNNNEFEAEKKLGQAFTNFCLTTACDKYRIEDLASAFNIPKEDIGEFTRAWAEIQHKTIEVTDNEKGRRFSRNNFYEHFLVKDKDDIVDARLDLSKGKFVRELKQIIDLQYSINLPHALGVWPLVSGDISLEPFYGFENFLKRKAREINQDELVFAATDFRPMFLTESVYVASDTNFTLDDISAIRQTREWETYLNAITNGKTRAKLNEVDLCDISSVWISYQHLINAIKNTVKGVMWKKAAGCVSVIYRVGSRQITAVYEFNKSQIKIIESNAQSGFKDRKTAVTIDYVCCDVTRNQRGSCLLTNIRLFEGRTYGTDREIYQALLDSLKEVNIKWNK